MAGRDLSKMNSLFGPGGCCDACGHPNWDLSGVGILCYKCHRGIFMHRQYWRYYFDGQEFVCAVPNDDVTEDMLREEYLRIAAYRSRCGDDVPAPLAERVAWARGGST